MTFCEKNEICTVDVTFYSIFDDNFDDKSLTLPLTISPYRCASVRKKNAHSDST